MSSVVLHSAATVALTGLKLDVAVAWLRERVDLPVQTESGAIAA